MTLCPLSTGSIKFDCNYRPTCSIDVLTVSLQSFDQGETGYIPFIENTLTQNVKIHISTLHNNNDLTANKVQDVASQSSFATGCYYYYIYILFPFDF